MNSVDSLTWDVVEARIDAGALAILPIGAGAKQHGRHLPMGTDRIQAEWLSERLAERFDALVWPTLTYGHYPAFVAYTGSCSLSAGVFEAVVSELTASLLTYGARVLLVDTGISTIAPINRAIADLGSRVLHLRIHDGPRYRVAARLATQPHGGHADELETSRMLALAPEAVVMARAAPSPATPPGPGAMQHRVPTGANYSASGSIGDPRAATRAKGEIMLEAMVADAVEVVADWLAAP